MQWVTVLMVGLAGFVGAGAVSMWRTQHRYAAGVLIALAVLFLAVGVVALLPGPKGS